jgi:hypothetical protein
MPYPTEVLYGDTAQIQHGQQDLFGSGRLIGKNLVLTAKHVVTVEGDVPLDNEGWQVRLLASFPSTPSGGAWSWIDSSVVWAGRGPLDLALLRLHPKAGTPDCYPKLTLRIGRIDEVRHHKVRGLGFPRGAKVDKKRTLFVPSGDLDDDKGLTLSFGIGQAYQPETPNEDWRGFSGGAVLLEESLDRESVWLYGVAQQVPSHFNRRLDVARLANAWEELSFRNLMRASEIHLEAPVDPLVFYALRSLPLRDSYDTARIRALVTDALSDEELGIFCMDYFRTVYEQFSTGMGKNQKAQRLIEYCSRHREFPKLLSLLKQANAAVFVANAPYNEVSSKDLIMD